MKTKQKPTPKHAEVRARQSAHGDSLRQWLRDRLAAAEKSRAARRKKAAKEKPPSRGVDRVPARYRVTVPEPEFLVEVPARSTYARRVKSKPGRPLPRLRERRAARLEYAIGEARVEHNRLPEEARNPNLETTVRRWAR